MKIKIKSIALLFSCLMLQFAYLPAGGQSLPAPQDWLKQAKFDVDTLSSNAMFGRGFTFNGHKIAATYIQNRFESIGLQAIEKSYQQPFSVSVNSFTEAPLLIVNTDTLLLGTDFLPLAISGSGIGRSNNRIVDVANGLYIPDKNINQFAGRQLQGSILIIDRNIPAEITEDKTIPAEQYSRQLQIAIARQVGAKALVFVEDKLTYEVPNESVGFPVFEVNRKAWPAEVKNIAFTIKNKVETIETQNVIGFLPGTDNPDKIVMLLAHYDHHGAMGEDFWFPGANDNASGIALMLALAKKIQDKPLPYSVLFVAFGAEEVGLAGSRYFAQNPLVGLEKIKFLLNFDMVGSAEQGVMAVGGKDFAEQYEVLAAVNDSLDLGQLRARKNAPNSDHYFLIEQGGIPGFYLYTNKGKQPYHSAGDIASTIEWDDFAHVLKLSEAFLRRLNPLLGNE